MLCRAQIVQGRVDKIAKEKALLEAAFVRDTNKTVKQHIQEVVAAVGENIQARACFPSVIITAPAHCHYLSRLQDRMMCCLECAITCMTFLLQGWVRYGMLSQHISLAAIYRLSQALC